MKKFIIIVAILIASILCHAECFDSYSENIGEFKRHLISTYCTPTEKVVKNIEYTVFYYDYDYYYNEILGFTQIIYRKDGSKQSSVHKSLTNGKSRLVIYSYNKLDVLVDKKQYIQDNLTYVYQHIRNLYE